MTIFRDHEITIHKNLWQLNVGELYQTTTTLTHDALMPIILREEPVAAQHGGVLGEQLGEAQEVPAVMEAV